MKKFIVAEISKNWDGNFDENTPMSGLINQKFEEVINVNYHRGYNLSEWQFSNAFDRKGHLNETILALFVLDETRIIPLPLMPN
jgi:hypothetical protein